MARPARPPRDRPQLTSPKRKSFLQDSRQSDFIEAPFRTGVEPASSAASLNGASIYGYSSPPQTLSPRLGNQTIPSKSIRSRSLERKVSVSSAAANTERVQNHSLTPRNPNPFTRRNGEALMRQTDDFLPRTGDSLRRTEDCSPRINDYLPRSNDSFPLRNDEPFTPRTDDCFTPRTDGPFTPRTGSRSGARHRVLKSIEVANKMMGMSIDDYELLKETGELPADAE
mmetsp:Transcript_5161/g.8921  ORF Transcript_5161/g.8921 Transcript_5161/m.8921 type:complete len:227 (-) Transcript_5161:32-712(-)|eukprot:CAMPEP_0196656484 /NCGR_PEP_ID=MMETSP1086-20130531/17410_1 /TAXON_ID=77921 /ORGANISM="Cyanoptyche  gloeocystis , Strain SAG4.97" /LENGTH=226 /DNA_ID=CAMNT_0041989245 /DNA_START=83 /DNA_END=763 /DNA_ORIENTATION=+